MWKDEFELHDVPYSVPDTPDNIEYTIKNIKHYLPILLFIFKSIELILD